MTDFTPGPTTSLPEPAEEDDDGPCTDCWDTGITIQTERACSCDAGDQYRPTPQPVSGDAVREALEGNDTPEDYVRYADAMLAKLFWPSGANRDDAKPYAIARNLAMAVKALAALNHGGTQG